MILALVLLTMLNVSFVWNQDSTGSVVNITFMDQIHYPAEEMGDPGIWRKLKNIMTNSSKPSFSTPQGIDARLEMLAVADAGAGGIHLLDFKQGEYLFIIPDNSTKLTPIDVAFANESILVSYSSEKTIMEFDLKGNYLRSIIPECPIKRITGIHYFEPYIYLVDTPGHSVLCIDYSGNLIFKIDSRGNTKGKLNFPTFIHVSENNRLYITDTMNFRVQVFDLHGNWLQSIGQRGISQGMFNRPKGVGADDQGNLFIVDASFDNIQVFTADGTFVRFYGATGHKAGQFEMPTDIAIVGSQMYVSDTMNRRIQLFEISYDN